MDTYLVCLVKWALPNLNWYIPMMLKLTFTLHPTRILIILVHVTSLILWFTLMKSSWKIWWYLINLWKNYLILFPLSIVRSTWMMTCTSLFLHEMSIGWNIPTKPMIHLLKEIMKKSSLDIPINASNKLLTLNNPMITANFPPHQLSTYITLFPVIYSILPSANKWLLVLSPYCRKLPPHSVHLSSLFDGMDF